MLEGLVLNGMDESFHVPGNIRGNNGITRRWGDLLQKKKISSGCDLA